MKNDEKSSKMGKKGEKGEFGVNFKKVFTPPQTQYSCGFQGFWGEKYFFLLYFI